MYMYKGNGLGFAAAPVSEAMLTIGKDFVLVKVVHDVTDHYMLQYLAA